MWSMLIPEKAAPTGPIPAGSQRRTPSVRNYVTWYTLIGTDPMSVLTVRMDAVAESGRNPVSKHQIQAECGK